MDLKFYQTYRYAVVRLGNIPAECIEEETILRTGTLRIFPGERLLHPDQKPKTLDLIRNFVDSILQAPNRKELEENLLQCQSKDTEVNERTAELYSKQRNTDITELVVIHETTQCETCKRKVMLHMWNHSARIINRKTQRLKPKTAHVMIRLSGLQWRSGRRSLTRHLSQEAQDHDAAKYHFRKAQQNNFEGCAIDWKDANDRKCVQEHDRTYETMESWDKLAEEPRNTHTMTPQQRQANFGNLWYVVQTTAEGSNTIPARQQTEVGQPHRARMDYPSRQRATASQAGSPSGQAQ